MKEIIFESRNNLLSKDSTKTLSRLCDATPTESACDPNPLHQEFHLRQTTKTKSILTTDNKTLDHDFPLEEHQDSEIIKKSTKLDPAPLPPKVLSSRKHLLADPLQPPHKQNINTLLFPRSNSSKKIWSTQQTLHNSSKGQIFESMDPRLVQDFSNSHSKMPLDSNFGGGSQLNSDRNFAGHAQIPLEREFVGLSQNEINLDFRRKLRQKSRNVNQSQNLRQNLKIKKLLSSQKKPKRKGSSQIICSNTQHGSEQKDFFESRKNKKGQGKNLKLELGGSLLKRKARDGSKNVKFGGKNGGKGLLSFKSKNLRKLFGQTELNESDFDFAKQRGFLKSKSKNKKNRKKNQISISSKNLGKKTSQRKNPKKQHKRQYSTTQKVKQSGASRVTSQSKTAQNSRLPSANRKLLKKIVSRDKKTDPDYKKTSLNRNPMSRNILNYLDKSGQNPNLLESKFLTETLAVDSRDKLQQQRLQRKKQNKLNRERALPNQQLQLITPRGELGGSKKKFYYRKRHLSQNYHVDLAENQTQQSIHLPYKEELGGLSPVKKKKFANRSINRSINHSLAHFEKSFRKKVFNLRESGFKKMLNSSSNNEFHRSQQDLKGSSSSLSRSVAPSNGFVTVREKIARGKLNPYNYTEKKVVLKNSRVGGRSELGNSGLSARRMDSGLTSVDLKKKYKRELYHGQSKVRVYSVFFSFTFLTC